MIILQTKANITGYIQSFTEAKDCSDLFQTFANRVKTKNVRRM